MEESTESPAEQVRPLVRVRQIREFTNEPVDAGQLEAITEAARWTGSSRNTQPWRFIVVRVPETLRRLAEVGLPQTRSLRTATAAVAVTVPVQPGMAISHAYDEGRAAERMLIAASLLGLGAGIAWVRSDVRDTVRELLALPEDRTVRTVVAIGHPAPDARRPKSPPGHARLPRHEVVFEERWPAS
jgi:nitroreductase